MLIKQIIKPELRRLGPRGRICTPATGYCYDKTKTSQENLQVGFYLLLKYCRRQCTLLSTTWAKSLTKFNLKMQDFKRLLGLTCKLK